MDDPRGSAGPPPDDDEPRRVARALRISTADGSLHAVMVGLSESTLGAFAVELGHGAAAIALLSTVPFLCGALTQLLVAEWSARTGRRRPFVVAGASLQCLAHALLIGIALVGSTSLALLLAAKVTFWIGGFAAGAPWNAWMSDLTRQIDRERYFGRRSAIVHVFLLASFLLGALVLDVGRARAEVLLAFAVVQGVGMLARALSTGLLAVQHERPGRGAPSDLRAVARDVTGGPGARLLVVTSLFTFGAWVSVPFYTPYMLRVMDMSYTLFASLIAVAIATKAVGFYFMRHVARRVGLVGTLAAGVAGVAAIPLVWASTPSTTAIALIQLVSGFAWAAYEYASFQLLLRTPADERKVMFFSVASLTSGVAQLSGGYGGGRALDAGLAYGPLFLASSAARAAPLLLFLVPGFRRGLPAADVPLPMPLRVESVRPAGGALHRPVVPATTEATPDPEITAAEIETGGSRVSEG